MDKPNDIPQDVWDTAKSLVPGYVRLSIVEGIARAILAERERINLPSEPRPDDVLPGLERAERIVRLFYNQGRHEMLGALKAAISDELSKRLAALSVRGT